MAEESTLMPPPARGGPTPSVPTLTILYHPDVARVGERVQVESAMELARASPAFHGRPLADRYLSRTPLRITRSDRGVALATAAGNRIAVDGQMIDGAWEQVCDRAALAAGVVIELAERVVVLLHLGQPGSASTRAHGLVGDSDAIRNVRADIDRVADLDVPVLLRGETGTGKELVASAIHAAGRTARPFVGVNVAALPPPTAASELFGHVRGAFTGATHDRDGMFVAADGGTLFLDEIGETPYDVQPMLLRVLETSEVTPLGGSRARRVVVRVIAATDADLETQIAESGFRSALFHRLAGYQLVIPPLRERRDDIGRLLIHCLRTELAATGDLARLERQHEGAQLWLPAPLVARFARYAWPGNVRQLRNAARQLAIASRGAGAARLDPVLDRLLATAPEPVPPAVATKRREVADITDDELVAALHAHRWRAVGAASALGVSRSTLYNLIDRSRRIRKARDVAEPDLRRALDAAGGDVDAAAAQLEVSPRALKLRVGELGWTR